MPHEFNATVNANKSLFDAFKQLTVGREENRGTLEITKWSLGDVTELKCSQHHFYSGRVKVPPEDAQALRRAMNKAIGDKLFGVKIEYGERTDNRRGNHSDQRRRFAFRPFCP